MNTALGNTQPWCLVPCYENQNWFHWEPASLASGQKPGCGGEPAPTAGANSSQSHISLPAVPWRQSNKHLQPINFIYFGENIGSGEGIRVCVFFHNACVPRKLSEGQGPGPRAPTRQWSVPFENRLLSLGEGNFSQLLQTPPIYNCLHITLTIYLRS